jgi:phosphoglycerate dehydrogenase-like enzyme
VDVFHREPLDPGYALLRAPGVLASPHIAGPTWDIYRTCGDHALENLRRYLAGEPVSAEVLLSAFERMT